MALTNILREPRREITETAVGIGIAVMIAVPDYFFAVWLWHITGGMNRNENPIPVPIGMILGMAVLFMGTILLLLLHLIGEGVCESLERRGIQLRPVRRL